MQTNVGSPQHLRNSYGFSFLEGFQAKAPQSKAFPVQPNYYQPQYN